MIKKIWNEKIVLFLKKESTKKTGKDLGVIAAIIFVVGMLAYAANGIFPFGDNSIARGDMVQQTIPNGMYYMWDVLHGKASPFFTWNSALGMNISGASSLSAILSPLNLLLYLCPRSALYYYANIFVLLKMIGLAFAMYFYLRKYEVPSLIHILGGVLYAFGAASLVHFQIMLVMDAAFFLPLLMIGLDRLIEKKKSRFFIITLALAMISNVYTGCILCIFLFLASGLRLFLTPLPKECDKKESVLRLFFAVLAGCLLSAVVSIPALLSISDTPRSQTGNLMQTYMTAVKSVWSENDWNDVKRMVVNMALPLAAIVFYLFWGNGKAKEKWIKYREHICRMLCMFLSVAVAGIELLWHGGSRACWPIRFIFVITFVLIDFAICLFRDNYEKGNIKPTRENRQKKGIQVLVSALVVSGVMTLVWHKIYEVYCSKPSYETMKDGFLCVTLEVIFLVLYFLFMKIKKGKAVILLLLCAELVGTSIISYAPNKDNVTVYNAKYLEAANNVAKTISPQKEDFVRIKNMDYKLDHIQYSLVLGRESISNYWHVLSPSLQPMYAALGYTINWTQLIDTGGTIFSDSLFQIREAMSERELPELLYEKKEDVTGGTEDSLSIYQTKLQFPFAVQTNVSSLAASNDKFETQNALFRAISGKQDSLIMDVSNQIVNGALAFQIGESPQVLYFYGTNTSATPVTIYVDGKPVSIPASYFYENVQYPSDFCNGLVCLGTFQNQKVTIQFSTDAAATDLHLGFLNYSLLEETATSIKEQGVKVTSLRQKHAGAKLSIENAKKGTIFVPIPYEEGWQCKVNGVNVSDQLTSFDGMLGIPVEEGTNDISLHYQAKGRKIGMIISLFTLFVCLGFYVLQRKEKLISRMGTWQKGTSLVLYVLFILAFVAFLILFFVIPTVYSLHSFIASNL